MTLNMCTAQRSYGVLDAWLPLNILSRERVVWPATFALVSVSPVTRAITTCTSISAAVPMSFNILQ